MLNPDYLYLTYDIVLDEEGKLRLDFYETTMEVEGKERKYVHQFVKSEYPEDLRSMISMLTAVGFRSLSSFNLEFWNVGTLNPILNLKLMLLSKNHKLLEKSYDDYTIINDMLYITKYIYYINMLTGQEYVMNVGTEKYSKENIEKLEANGFKSILDSSLIKHSVLNPEENIRNNKR